ncbi:1-acyl-sn-glycerol-3-phosphate acyltransferase [Chitiniphilus shinanonensis]|uniref:1-acyl-sn-glycerol-3-phosphate acyltransferase n=1 Tax=Chitiniphilus shinanonensis TaxID=553088 RepID=A0ABQ6BT11_9NEIS|nr:lysophospholipid acyltransferase family protein [Chitiniphilus shinanonensis]GLS03686.1 1-acyl-sn-glycerol-3-phosphate acyltransferase [Chitiniphilus shinanonensis]
MYRHWLRLQRLFSVLCHLGMGIAIATWRFPRMDENARLCRIQAWSRTLAKKLGITVRVQGVVPGLYPPNHLLLANHISWLDIFVLNTETVSRFVAKSEIRGWPVVGSLCHAAGTLFIERERKRDTARVSNAMIDALREGHCVAVFPEGTTSDGRCILPFRSSLLQAAIDSDATIQPIYLRYVDTAGNWNDAAAYINEMSLSQSLWRLLGAQGLVAEINFLAPFAVDGEDRRTLTRYAETRIKAAHEALNGLQASPTA